MSEYAARIRAARAYANLTQEQLADELGVDVQTVKRREAGRQDPKKSELIAIAALTGVPLSFMTGGWEALAAPPSDEQISRAAALLRPALLQAGRAVGQAPEEAPEQQVARGHS